MFESFEKKDSIEVTLLLLFFTKKNKGVKISRTSL